MKEQWCRWCMEDITKHQSIYDFLKQDAVLCSDCKRQLQVIDSYYWFDKLPLYVAYAYNEFMEGMLYQYKEGHDVALAEVFFYDILTKLQVRYRKYTIVLLPSSEEKQQERGFHPVREMLKQCKLPCIEPFDKENAYRQVNKPMQHGSAISQVIKLKSNTKLPQTRLLLVDDVTVSGNTLQWAYQQLQGHTYRIEALVLSAHPDLLAKAKKRKKKGMFSVL